MFCSLSVKVENRVVLIVGGGVIGLRRARYFVESGADIRVVSLDILDDFKEITKDIHIEAYRHDYLDGISIVVAATDSEMLNKQIASEARRRGIWVNNASDRTDCDFHFPAVVASGDLRIAISSEGKDLEGVLSLKQRIQEFLCD